MDIDRYTRHMYLFFFTMRAIWGMERKREPPMTSQPTTTATMLTSGLAFVNAGAVDTAATLTEYRWGCKSAEKSEERV